jgi:hypothetical protein
MRENLPAKLLLQLLEATPEEMAAIERILCGGKTEIGKAVSRNRAPGAERHTSPSPLPRAERESPRFVFRRIGKFWEVIFRGGRLFHLEDTLGTKYLDYFLHHPNDPISAFDLEVAIQPEKGVAWGKNSIQPESDAQAMREYRQELRRLQMETAQAAGEPEEVVRQEGKMEALKSALKGAGAADTGERAFDNLRKALRVVLEQLGSGGPEEQAFAEHLRTHLSIGFECLYTQPQGRIWG